MSRRALSLVVCASFVVPPALAADAKDAALVRNPGFESKLDGWSPHVFGARPTIEVDAQVKHEGKQSLRIETTEPSDVALSQEVGLKPGRCYRFTGWVRTRKLD